MAEAHGGFAITITPIGASSARDVVDRRLLGRLLTVIGTAIAEAEATLEAGAEAGAIVCWTWAKAVPLAAIAATQVAASQRLRMRSSPVPADIAAHCECLPSW